MEITSTYSVGGKTFATKAEAQAWLDLQQRISKAEQWIHDVDPKGLDPRGFNRLDTQRVATFMANSAMPWALALAEAASGTNQLPDELSAALAQLLNAHQEVG